MSNIRKKQGETWNEFRERLKEHKKKKASHNIGNKYFNHKYNKIKRKTLVKDLDKWFSIFIRNRDKKCVVCGSTERLQCGHLFTRAHYTTRWDEGNCFGQCAACNMKHEYDPYPFLNWFIGKFGKEKLDELHIRHNKMLHLMDYQIGQLRDHYKKLVKQQIDFFKENGSEITINPFEDNEPSEQQKDRKGTQRENGKDAQPSDTGCLEGERGGVNQHGGESAGGESAQAIPVVQEGVHAASGTTGAQELVHHLPDQELKG